MKNIWPLINLFASKFIWTVFFFTSNIFSSEIPEHILDRGIDHAVEITKKFPPSSYHIVNFGPTSVVVATALKALEEKIGPAKEYMSEIAITGVKNVTKYSTDELDRLFEQIIPSSEILNGRKLVLNRVISGGVSMNTFMPALLDFLKRKRPKTKLTYYWIHQHGKEELSFFKNVIKHPNFEHGILVRDPEYSAYFFNYIDRTRPNFPRDHLTNKMANKEISLSEAIDNGCCDKNPKIVETKKLYNRTRERVKEIEKIFDIDILKKCMMFILSN